VTGAEAIEPRRALRRVVAGGDLAAAEMESLLGQMMDGTVSDILEAALLTALAAKGESVEELTGAARAMRSRVVPIAHHRQRVVDTCGTGGDGAGTFNISTAAALVAAACGVPIAKHGNRSVSSRSGSADVLERLGVRLDLPPAVAASALDEIGIAFLFAPRLHPAMREVMPVRRELGMRTLFNLLGPLTNPAGARRQVLGVYAADRVAPVAEVLAALGTEHALVVHGEDGLDEITTTTTTRVAEVRQGTIREYRLEPEEVGIERVAAEVLVGGEPEENAELMRRLLAGETGPLAEITVLNAGAAIYVGDRAESLAAGVEQARRALASGAAAAKLEALCGFAEAS